MSKPAMRSRVGRAAIISGAASLVIGTTLGAVALTANADEIPDPGYEDFPGNATTCEQAGLEGVLLIEGEEGSEGNAQIRGIVSDNNENLNVEVLDPDVTVTGTVVKGGPNYRVYYGDPVPDMHSPEHPKPGSIPDISHWFVCGIIDDGGDESGADENGADENGADENGADENGADENGADENGADENGADENGADENGADENGADENGADENGADENGADENGADENGADENGADENGADENGADENGAEDGTDKGGDNGAEDGTDKGGDNGTENGEGEELPDTGVGTGAALGAVLLIAAGAGLALYGRRVSRQSI